MIIKSQDNHQIILFHLVIPLIHHHYLISPPMYFQLKINQIIFLSHQIIFLSHLIIFISHQILIRFQMNLSFSI
jgi:hypothetical protein